MEIAARHTGHSIVGRNGEEWAFRHYNDSTQNPLQYGARYDALAQRLDPIRPSPASGSLIRALLAREGVPPSAEDIELFLNPGGIADLVLTKSVHTADGVDLLLTNLVLGLNYDFRPRSPERVRLEVQVPDGLAPYMSVDQRDVAGRQDGRGTFRRTYRRNTPVTVEAPTRYGNMRFVKWTDEAGRDLGDQSANVSQRVTMNADKIMRAQYVMDADGGPPNPGRTNITVTISGQGAVSGANGPVPVGSVITLNATPRRGFVFASWSGSITSQSPRLTLVMAPGLTLQANFAPSPYQTGRWEGLYYETNGVEHASSGSFRLTTTPGGAYVLRMQMGSRRYAVSGQLSASGTVTNSVRRSGATPLTVGFALDMAGNPNLVTGSIAAGLEFTAQMLGDRIAINPSTPNPFAGRYTAVIFGDGQGMTMPGGNGYVTITVGRTSGSTLSGVLADGTVFTRHIPVSASGHAPLYVPLYSGRGSMVGWLNFTNGNTRCLGSRLSWYKPSLPLSRFYPEGFTVDTSLAGADYVPPRSGGLPIRLAQGRVILSGGGLVTPLTEEAQLLDGLRVGRNLTVQLKPSSGLFHGTLIAPENGLRLPFKGVFLQGLNLGSGFFLDGSRSGLVLWADPLTP